MPRTLVWCAALALCALTSRADQSVTPAETVIRLTVQPMATPQPALRYLLLPELKEQEPGNPIPNYLKYTIDPNPDPNRPIGRAALREVDWAARLDKPDWQILPKVRTDGIGLLLPDVQKLRSLIAALRGRFAEEVAQERFDDVIVTAKTMFAMSRHAGEHPTLIGSLVGIAFATIAIDPLEEMLQQPGCPNLYWALTNLPSPLVPLDKGLEGERALIRAEFRDLDDRAPMSAEQIKRLARHIDGLRKGDTVSEPYRSTRAWLDDRVKDERLLAAARGRLVEYGLPEERVARFPAEQVFLLDERREYEVRRDELMKLMALPVWQAGALIKQAQPPKGAGLLVDLLLPGLEKIHIARGRLEQRIALLRHVEGLRLYAAAHDGRLPGELSEVPVPLPPDPFTGQPFRYRRDGATAHVRGTPPRGWEAIPAYNLHYEVTIRQ